MSTISHEYHHFPPAGEPAARHSPNSRALRRRWRAAPFAVRLSCPRIGGYRPRGWYCRKEKTGHLRPECRQFGTKRSLHANRDRAQIRKPQKPLTVSGFGNPKNDNETNVLNVGGGGGTGVERSLIYCAIPEPASTGHQDAMAERTARKAETRATIQRRCSLRCLRSSLILLCSSQSVIASSDHAGSFGL